jgi:hypothetical protein
LSWILVANQDQTTSNKLICKDVTADQMLRSVANLRQWAFSIEPYVSWMSGLPGETDEDLAETFDLMDRMREVNPKTQHYGIFVYTPFPSTVMQYLPPEFTPPQTLEEWIMSKSSISIPRGTTKHKSKNSTQSQQSRD